jgi:hypothetical protein
LHALDDWRDAQALVLSCPGTLRRHEASLVRLDRIRLTQIFLGGEAQLLAFAAAFGPLRQKMFFAPLPELFSAAAGLDASWRALGLPPPDPKRIVHLRFGSVREARILKGTRNLAVVAEAPVAKPMAAAPHPFAVGDVLPAAMQLVLTYAAAQAKPTAFGGIALPIEFLPASCVTGDLAELARADADPAGLDLLTLRAFDEAAWAEGDVARDKPRRGPCVLIPWNLAHPGSIVPELLARLAAFADGGATLPMLVLLPFNDLGQAGTIRGLTKRLTAAAARPEAFLDRVAIARVTSLGGLHALRDLAARAWVDGGDPEAWWTLARLDAAGVAPMVLSAPRGGAPPVPAEDSLVLHCETRFGALSFEARLPALRDLPALLATADAPRKAKSGRGA